MDHPNANMVTSSFDRTQGTFDSPIYQPYNNFRIQNYGGNIVQGQVNKLSVSEVMFPYDIPTIVNFKNNVLTLAIHNIDQSGNIGPITTVETFIFKTGFFTGDEIVTELNNAVSQESDTPLSDYLIFTHLTDGTIEVISANTFSPNGATSGVCTEFVFEHQLNSQFLTDYNDAQANPFNFPNLCWTLGLRNIFAQVPPAPFNNGSNNGLINVNICSSGCPVANLPSSSYLRLISSPYTGRYTEYVDIVSRSLCQAQYVRDSTTSQNTPQRDVIARIYVCNNISTLATDPEGTAPFIIHRMFPVPKVMKWTADRSIDAIDLALYDMYGQPIPNISGQYDLFGTKYTTFLAGPRDYAITFHVHEPTDQIQNENVGYRL